MEKIPAADEVAALGQERLKACEREREREREREIERESAQNKTVITTATLVKVSMGRESCIFLKLHHKINNISISLWLRLLPGA